jgi:hypothetical protein
MKLLSFILLTIWFTAGPLVLTAAAAFLGWAYRLVNWGSIPKRESKKDTVAQRYQAMRADAVTPAPEGSAAAAARDQAKRINANVRRVHLGAWLVYGAITFALFFGCTNSTFGWPARLYIGYAVLAPQLLILFWAIRLPMRRRLFLLLLFVLAGAGLVLAFRPQNAAVILGFVTFACALVPIPGLLFLFIRRNQPFLFLLMAIAAYCFGTGFILNRVYYANVDIEDYIVNHPWLVFLGLFDIVLGLVGAWLLVRQPHLWPRVVTAAAGVLAAILLHRDLTAHNLPVAVTFVCFVLLSMLPMLTIWSIFKALIRLGEQRFLTIELVQIHLCWINLTVYYAATTTGVHSFWENRTIPRWGVFVALALFILALHILLHRIVLNEKPFTEKRLLLLRVFGKPNEREDLLDDLSDTWRRIGALDLLAASDVAARTLDSHMLEAFLLRRSKQEFLVNADQLHRRLSQRRSKINADGHYPVDAFFCDHKTWFQAFEQLAATSHVALMDVRGFTTANKSCVEELKHLLRHPETPLVMVSDKHSDLDAIDELAREAKVTRELTILHFGERSTKQRQALFELLLKAAFPS